MYDPYNPYETEKPKIEINFKRNRISTKKNGIGTVNAGGAIIIIIFVVLCLTIFGLLSFTTSFADKKLADRNLQSVSQYYKADSEAEEKLAIIYDAVYNKIQTTANFDFDDYFVTNTIANISGDKYDFSGIEAWEEESPDQNTNAAGIFYRTDMGTVLDGSLETIVNFYLESGIIFYYNNNTGKLSYKIYKWKQIIEKGFKYGEEELNVWMPDSIGFNDDGD